MCEQGRTLDGREGGADTSRSHVPLVMGKGLYRLGASFEVGDVCVYAPSMLNTDQTFLEPLLWLSVHLPTHAACCPTPSRIAHMHHAVLSIILYSEAMVVI